MAKTTLALAAAGVVAMLSANVSMIPTALIGLPCFPRCFLTSLPADIQACTIFLLCLVAGGIIVDAKALLHMFVDLSDPESKTGQWKLSAALNFSPQARATFRRLVVAVNWAAGSGLLCSAFKLSVLNPLPEEEYIIGDMSFKIAHDLIVGDLQLNPLLRDGVQQRWESAYGLLCAFYLVLHFGFSVTRSSDFVFTRFFLGKGAFFGAAVIASMAFAGLFGQGIWPVACLLVAAHLMLLWMACRLVVHREVAKGGKGRSLRAMEKLLCTLKAGCLLFTSSLLLAGHMAAIYVLGKTSVWSTLLIYGPITISTLILIRDGHSKTMTISCVLVIGHGIAHLVYPFIDENQGVVKGVDVWQDQCLHAGQAILFSTMWFHQSPWYGKVLLVLFSLGGVSNAVIGYFCWGTFCHDLYVWISLVPSLASGLHFAAGCLHKSSEKVARYGFLLQGLSSVTTYFIFRRSDDILKFSARCRFFEVYFVAPHLVGFIYGRYVINAESPPQPLLQSVSEVLGIDRTPRTPDNKEQLDNYFHVPVKAA
mmetsp:Transcript_20844/g.37537  ORF Transcript_20844/g.37537 Transcript_20844/m.37537 type:complete len:536 (+) Transcript_20844:63-1670(+)|eukprot:CAMPEP_0197658744 /NCGR_PEP_ID=MMETSP1338-20131121/45412_1 /TAXON_ID=43686 ORGANISM="Pelagodinium beii, Strain RCC1491" /NCGR_SAMPLE_ID=MMETSP1338 /ASSEMBLY_ACC=CAM_ASM_000754 /LENGTH=535 /DNA_ID=CAMNT_0043235381 /DNA_START=55 /DNA_END=1662 /DNA_ORIENTATION=+